MPIQTQFPGGFFKKYIRDEFTATQAALGGIWTARSGTFEAAGGVAKAKTLALDGNNLVANGEFTTDTTGWLPIAGGVLTRRDLTSSPDIDPTGGTDDYGLEVLHSTAAQGYGEYLISFIPGAGYTATCRAYSPSSNTQTNSAMLFLSAGVSASATASTENSWQTLTTNFTPTTTGRVRCYCQGSTLNDLVYFDKVVVQQSASIATCDPKSANINITVNVTMPASGIIPFGIMARYQDASHYWLWRIRPGTAGTDCELVEVNGATQTVRSSADIDWVAGQTYALKLVLFKTNIAAYVDTVLKLSYVSTYLQTATICGMYDTGVANAQFDNWLITNYSNPGIHGLIVSGDSITDAADEWAGLLAVADLHYVLFNHAVSGQKVIDNMLNQVSASASEAGTIAICQLSTNDTNYTSTFQDKYLEALQWLQANHPGIRIYCMGTLDRTNMSNVDTKRTMIAAAAAAAGATYWDTSGWIDPVTDTSDGLHPNPTGSAKIRDQVLARLNA